MRLWGRKKAEEEAVMEHDKAVKDETERQTAYRMAQELQMLAAEVVQKAAELTQEIERDRQARGESVQDPGGTSGFSGGSNSN
jgi:hypothetical protein